MKFWIGKFVVFIGIIHTLFGVLVFSSTILEILREGLINTVNGQTSREFVFWFIFWGFIVIIFGLLVDWCERKDLRLPNFLGWSLLFATIIGVIIMPISGIWLLFMPSIGIILKNHRKH